MGYKSPADVLSAVINTSTSADLNVRNTTPVSLHGTITVGTVDVIGVSASVALPVSTGVVEVFAEGHKALPVSTGTVTIAEPVTIDVTSDKALPVSTGTVTVDQSAPVSSMINPYDTVASSAHKAAAASTAYQLPNQACVAVAIKARPGNSGNIWVGPASTVSNTSGYPLDAGDPISLTVSNVNKLYYWADTANDWVCWITIN